MKIPSIFEEKKKEGKPVLSFEIFPPKKEEALKNIDATLDMTGFTGESVIYAVRVPRSYYSSGGRMGYLHGESYFFLLAGEDPNK